MNNKIKKLKLLYILNLLNAKKYKLFYLNHKSNNKSNHKNDNIIQENEKICRICYDIDSNLELINPCKCKGTIKWVHNDCLSKWLAISKQDSCKRCHYKFKYTPINNYLNLFHKNSFQHIISFMFFMFIIAFHILLYNLYRSILAKKYTFFRFNYKIFKQSIQLIIINIMFLSTIVLFIPKLKEFFLELNDTVFNNSLMTSVPLIDILIYIYNLIKNVSSIIIKKKIPLKLKFLNYYNIT